MKYVVYAHWPRKDGTTQKFYTGSRWEGMLTGCPNITQFTHRFNTPQDAIAYVSKEPGWTSYELFTEEVDE